MLDRIVVVDVLVHRENQKPQIGDDDPELGVQVIRTRHVGLQPGFFRDVGKELSYRPVRLDQAQGNDEQGEENRQHAENPLARRHAEKKALVEQHDQRQGEGDLLGFHGQRGREKGAQEAGDSNREAGRCKARSGQDGAEPRPHIKYQGEQVKHGG